MLPQVINRSTKAQDTQPASKIVMPHLKHTPISNLLPIFLRLRNQTKAKNFLPYFVAKLHSKRRDDPLTPYHFDKKNKDNLPQKATAPSPTKSFTEKSHVFFAFIFFSYSSYSSSSSFFFFFLGLFVNLFVLQFRFLAAGFGGRGEREGAIVNQVRI